MKCKTDYRMLALVVVLIIANDASAQIRTGQAVISGYDNRDCVKKGQQVVVMGMGFGNAQGLNHVVLWGHGESLNMMVVSWLNSRITAMLPNDARIGEGRTYQIGLQDRSGNWVSNIGPSLKICAAQAPAKDSAPARAAQTVASVGAQAQSLADAVVKASGGNNWAKVKSIRFTFNVEQDGKPLMSATHNWDLRAWTDTVTWQGKTVLVNLAHPASDEDAKAAYARWVNDSYWLLAPLKLKDPGVTLTYQSREGGFEVLHAQFANVGLTPGDQYNFYVDPATHLVRRWDYMPSPDKKISGTWEGYKDFGGLNLSTERRFGDKHIWFSGVEVQTE